MAQTQDTPVYVRLAVVPMMMGRPAWPHADRLIQRREAAQATLRQALVDVLGYEGDAPDAIGSTAADAVAAALISALGNGRWSLRTQPKGGEILGAF